MINIGIDKCAVVHRRKIMAHKAINFVSTPVHDKEETEIIAEDERHWDAAFDATTPEQFAKLQAKVRQSIKKKGKKPLDFTDK